MFLASHSSGILRAITRVRSRFPNLMSQEDVADVHADLCLQLLAGDKRRLRLFDVSRGTPLGVWLATLARHAAYDFLRRRGREPRCLPLCEEVIDASHAHSPDAYELCCSKERVRVLAELIRELPPRDREFVAVYYGEGLDPEQTAERLGICVATVYSKKHKIRARIECLLEKRLAA